MARSEAASRPPPCRRRSNCPLLTEREIQVLLLAAAGLPNRQIARTLNIALRTAEQHLETMMRRAGAGCRGELIARSFVAGVLLTGAWPPAWSGKLCVSLGECGRWDKHAAGPVWVRVRRRGVPESGIASI